MSNFDRVAENISEVVEAILSAERDRDRRLELIRHHIRRAIIHGWKTARGNNNKTQGGQQHSQVKPLR
jgi:hypothetical protein